MSKHIPGPWLTFGYSGDILRASDEEKSIASVHQWGDVNLETRRATARLIAAAPEMLEILQVFYKAYEKQPGQLGNGKAMGTWIAARELIEKLEGK